MRTRFTFLALFALLLVSTNTGCRALCAVEQWKCDTFGTCGFGTQPSYGTFAPPGPYPQPTPAPLGQPAPFAAPGGTTFQPGPVLGPPQDLSTPPSVPSF